MTTRMSMLAATVLSVLLLAAGSILLPTTRSTTADDTAHATSLVILSKDYGFGDGPEQAIVGRIDSTDAADKRARVEISALLPGTTSYRKMCGSTAHRSPSDGLFSEATQPVLGYPSGTVVQAAFSTFDAAGLATFTFTRSVTIP